MKAVIACGGYGTRLAPITQIINKHLVPILNQPMILYPLRTARSFGITEICIVSGGENIGGFTEFLGKGTKFGCDITYRVQEEAGGIASALYEAKSFVNGDDVLLILGDNFFEQDFVNFKHIGPTIFVKDVENPSRFGVYDLTTNTIEEKPENPKSHSAVVGMYLYDSRVFDYIEQLSPSSRGELEITDVNNLYLKSNACNVSIYGISGVWSDMGTVRSKFETEEFLMDSTSRIDYFDDVKEPFNKIRGYTNHE